MKIKLLCYFLVIFCFLPLTASFACDMYKHDITIKNCTSYYNDDECSTEWTPPEPQFDMFKTNYYKGSLLIAIDEEDKDYFKYWLARDGNYYGAMPNIKLIIEKGIKLK
mgnify:FL=1